MTAQEEAKFLRQVDEIHAIVTKKMDNGLVGDGQQRPLAPTYAAQNPGEFYQTQYDPLAGYESSSVVIAQFSPPIDDGEGGKIWKFVSGYLYDWARADLAGFMKYYEHRYGTPLVLSKLHPDQRKLIGI